MNPVVPLRLNFDDQIFSRQPRGGISRYFRDLINFLKSDSTIRITTQREASIVHATFYGGKPYRLRKDQMLISSLFDMTPEIYPEFFPLSRFRSPHANKLGWLRKSDSIISISQASADDLCFFEPSLSNKVFVAHLATEIHYVNTKPVQSLEKTRFWLIVGKRRGYKNALTALRSLQRLGKKGENPVRLVFAGGEAWGPRDEYWLKNSKLQNLVLPIHANDEELAWLYRNAEAVLVPSLAEGFSLPLIEALVCDTPVVASDLEAHREVAGSYATLIPALNVSIWSEVLRESISQPLQRPSQLLGKSEFERQVAYYSLKRMVQSHKSIYSSCIA